MHGLGKCGSRRAAGRTRIAWAPLAGLIVGMVGVMIAPAARATSRTPHLETIVRGLDNPRGLVFLPSGKLAVAEAGHAGPLCLGGQCGGLTGQIISFNPGTRRTKTLAAGFPSIGGPFAPFGLGGLAVSGGRLYAIVGENPQQFGNPNKDCQGQPNSGTCVATLKKIISEVGNFVEVRSLSANNGWRTIARVGQFDYQWATKHPQPLPDADPFGLIAGAAGQFFIVDGASNTLGSVTAQGTVSVLAFVPDPVGHKPIYDAAPTCAARTPNGALIIGTEAGSLWRWKDHRMTRLLLGGKVQQVVACVADARGNVYLANLDRRTKNFIGGPFTGSVIKVTPSLRTSYIATGLNYPTGMTFGPDGHLYITVNGLCPGNLSLINSQNSPPHACPGSGQVLKIN